MTCTFYPKNDRTYIASAYFVGKTDNFQILVLNDKTCKHLSLLVESMTSRICAILQMFKAQIRKF